MGKGGRSQENSRKQTKEGRGRKQTARTLEIQLAMIEEEDFDLASIIRVDDSGAGIDEVFHC